MKIGFPFVGCYFNFGCAALHIQGQVMIRMIAVLHGTFQFSCKICSCRFSVICSLPFSFISTATINSSRSMLLLFFSFFFLLQKWIHWLIGSWAEFNFGHRDYLLPTDSLKFISISLQIKANIKWNIIKLPAPMNNGNGKNGPRLTEWSHSLCSPEWFSKMKTVFASDPIYCRFSHNNNAPKWNDNNVCSNHAVEWMRPTVHSIPFYSILFHSNTIQY